MEFVQRPRSRSLSPFQLRSHKAGRLEAGQQCVRRQLQEESQALIAALFEGSPLPDRRLGRLRTPRGPV